MKVKTLIKRLQELPVNANIYRRGVFGPTVFNEIEETTILKCQNGKYPTFWEFEHMNQARKPSQKVKVLEKRKCYIL